MATLNSVSPRDEVEAAKARVAVRRSQSDASGESDAVVDVPFTLPEPLISCRSERTARKARHNSGIPPSQTERNGNARRLDGGGFRKVVREKLVEVDVRGADLTGVNPAGNAASRPVSCS